MPKKEKKIFNFSFFIVGLVFSSWGSPLAYRLDKKMKTICTSEDTLHIKHL